MATTEHTVAEAYALQAAASGALGSPMYGALLAELGRRHQHDRAAAALRELFAEAIADRTHRVVHDALVLRIAAAVHRLVLSGDEPALARHYPSVGGSPGVGLVDEFLDVVTRRRAEIHAALDEQLQTNEVGRSAVLVGGFCLLGRRHARPLQLFELGASAGLNLRWDRFWFDSGTATLGDPASRVRFTDVWAVPPVLSDVEVATREGCDISPLDVTDPAARLRLLSFVWPDQRARFVRLRAALDLAVNEPVVVTEADAGAWVADRLSHRLPGRTAVVYHSIVWQYLGTATRNAVKVALGEHGARATDDRPLAWLRMEPAGPVADLRLTTWPGGHTEVLATSSYHGAGIDWTGPI